MRISAGKITVPRLPAEFVQRPGLRKRLDGAGSRDIVVVSAPAGYGKSLLLADWAGHHPARTAWVTVDADDDTPGRLWAAVGAALASCPAVPAGSRLRGRWHEGGNSPVDDLLAALDDLDDVDGPILLVLDDLHEVTSPDVLGELARLVRHRPDVLRPVLAGRIDPPLSLPRLRLEGRLCEIRIEQLRFTPAEASDLLHQTGHDLDTEFVEALVARADGWAAGLRLAAVTLHRHTDAERFLAEFSGDDRSVADYLTSEMMAGLDPPALDLLRAASICCPLSDDLAVHLSERADTGTVLDRLAHDTGLIEVRKPGTYRIHALLRSYLLANLQRRSPSRYRRLHGRAARWWADRDEPAHALRHAERAEDAALLEELLHRFGVTLMLRGETEPLLHALTAARSGARAADPALALLSALVHLQLRSYAVAAVELAQARRAWPERTGTPLTALLAAAELLSGAFTDPGAAPPAAAGDLPDDLPPDRRALLHVCRGLWGLGHPAARAGARDDVERALHLARVHGYEYLEVQALTVLAALAWMHGDGHESHRYARDAVDAAARCGRHPSPWSCGGVAFLAHQALLHGDPAAAAAWADEALRGPTEPSPEFALLLHAVRGAARADTGDGVAGLAEARAARTRHGDVAGAPEWFTTVAVLEHRTALLMGNTSAAVSVTDWLEHRVGRVGEVVLMRAQADAATGHRDGLAELDVLGGGATDAVAVPPLLASTRLEVLLFRAERALDAGDDPAGRAALGAALSLGRALDVVRPFALAAPRVRAEVSRFCDRSGRSPYAARVAAALAAVEPDVVVPLTERETAVLALLPSLLTIREIADELSVSLNTVKTHVRSIYAKLGVSRRRDAVHRAQERGLLH